MEFANQSRHPHRGRLSRLGLRLAPLLVGVLATAVVVGCADDGADDGGADDADATATATITLPTVTSTLTDPAPTSTATPDETGTPGDDGEGPAVPTNVSLSGPLPDTDETVAPGEGETGRVTVEWSYEDDDISGFRVYQRECDGTVVAEPLEVGGDERQYGPLQPCRPGGDIGVSAVDETGESEIVWAQESAGDS